MNKHGMLAGSHERLYGPTCKCGKPWSRWEDRCTSGEKNPLTPTTEDVASTWNEALWEGIASDAEKEDADWEGDRRDAQFDRWLEQVKAEAWAEGYSYCFDMERRGIDNVSLRDNPYRKGETE